MYELFLRYLWSVGAIAAKEKSEYSVEYLHVKGKILVSLNV